jgi:hypothetical protein
MILYKRVRDISDFIMIEIITTSLFVLSSVYGAPIVASADTISTTTTPLVTVNKQEITIEKRFLTEKQLELEKKAKEYFKDDPILVKIAGCESQFRQYDANGDTLKGKVNKGDLGLMQINKYYHADKADQLGFNLDNVEGNMAYAKYLYDREGSKPWNSSSKCWKQEVATGLGNQQLALNK